MSKVLILSVFICVFSFNNFAKSEDIPEYRPFRHSELYYEIKARKWMKELTQKAEKSLKAREELDQLRRLKELRELSIKHKLQLKNRRIVDGIFGKNFL